MPAPDEIKADRQSRFFEALCTWGGPESSIRAARDAVLDANDGHPPKVLDPFSGGGAIPLETARLGCDVVALELNPVAHIIELCTLDYPQRFGSALATDVYEWGTRFVNRARAEVGHLYPDPRSDGSSQATLDGSAETNRRVPIAYFWTRTVPCPNPAERPHTVPLVRQTWLRKKQGDLVALRLLPDRRTMTIEYQVAEASTEVELGFDPGAFSERGSTSCPLCGASVDVEYVREQGLAHRLGVDLMAVGLVQDGKHGKSYLGSAAADELLPRQESVDAMLGQLARHGFEPPSELVNVQDTQSFRTALYGLVRFGDLFTGRQQVLLLTLSRNVASIHEEMLSEGVEPPRAKAIATYLGLLVDRIADRSSTLCRWNSSPRAEKTENTFARQALPMTWDFSEANPFGGASGDMAGQLGYIVDVIAHCARTGRPVNVIRGSAMEIPLDDGSIDAVITDPPYYDNISYADLSDFFYVWLKRSLGFLHPEHLSGALTPKRGEAIAARYRHDGDADAAKAAYEEMMSQSFAECRRVLKSDGIMVCVYAHQTTAGWATLIEAVRRAGFVVVEAWPLDTEMATRGVAQGTASLASSIFLVARPRSGDETGDWAHNVRPELAQIVEDRVETLANLGISGTDLVIAAIGAGMRAYTRFSRVEKPNGEELQPDEYLDEVEREVAETILARIFQTDRAGLGRVDQQTQFYVMGRFEFGKALAPWDELNTLARGTGVELKEMTLGDDALIGFGKKRSEARLRDYSERGEAIELGRGTIDHLHRVLWLAENAPERVKEYLDFAQPDADRLRLVAHALSRPGLDASTDRGLEAEACERLLASFKRLVEDNLFTQSGA